MIKRILPCTLLETLAVSLGSFEVGHADGGKLGWWTLVWISIISEYSSL